MIVGERISERGVARMVPRFVRLHGACDPLRHAGGQGLVEYSLILAGVALVAIVALVFFGDALSAVLDAIGAAIDQATR